MEPRLKASFNVQINVESSRPMSIEPSSSSAPPPPQQQQHVEQKPQHHQMPPPSSAEWNNQQFSSPDAVSPKANGAAKCFSPYSQEDMGPFVEQLLPYVRASAYNWFHIQAAKRRYFKDFDRKMSIADENKKMVELQNDRDELKVKWASRLLGKIKKDIQNEHKDSFIAAINGSRAIDCILSVADQKGKMRRIDCLRQADKVWRLDLVTIILFKGIPLESTDGERLERCDSCTMPALCINPFHMSISIRGLDIFLATYLKDIETKIVLKLDPKKKKGEEGSEGTNEVGTSIVVKQEPGEIAAPHAILGTSSTHNRVWEPQAGNNPGSITLEYDPQQAAHTYFGAPSIYIPTSIASGFAVDNNFYDPKKAVLCLPPPSPVGCLDFPEGSSDGQQLEISEDSNDEPLEKRSRDLSSHDSPNSSTNDEVRRIVGSGITETTNHRITLGRNSAIWSPVPGQYARIPVTQEEMVLAPPARPVRLTSEFRADPGQPTAFRPKPVRRMTVNAGNGDVGVVVLDARLTQNGNGVNVASSSNVNSTQSLVSALSSLRTSPGHPVGAGRKRVHQGTNSPLHNVLNAQYLMSPGVSATEVSPPHAVVANLISRENNGYMASPTKFTTARGDTISFSKILQKVEQQQQQQEQQQQQQQNQPSTSANYIATQNPPSFISTKPESSVKIIAPVPLKPQMIPISARVTPYGGLIEEDSLATVIGHLTNGNEIQFSEDNFLHFFDNNSRSPLLNQANGTFSALTMSGVAGISKRPESSASNGSTSLTGAMGLIAPPNIALAVSQAPTAMSPIHPVADAPGTSGLAGLVELVARRREPSTDLEHAERSERAETAD